MSAAKNSSSSSRIDNEMLRSMQAPSGPKLDAGMLEVLHIAFTAMASLFALVIGLYRLGLVGFGLALGFAFLNLVALLLGRSIRLVLSDFYRQFQYREKFALFLGHAALFFAPYFVLQLPTWAIPMGFLLVALSVQSIDAVFFGRIYAVTMLLAFFGVWKGGYGNPMPPAALLASYFFFLLLALRFGHLRFRLEAEGGGLGLDMTEALRQTILPSMLPPAIGLVVYIIGAQFLFPRQWAFRLDPSSQPTAPILGRSSAEIFWTAIITVGVIVGCLVLLAWLERKLRGKGKGKAEEVDPLGATARMLAEEAAALDAVHEERATGPRERILLAFKKFARIHARQEAETAETFLARTQRERVAELFNDACYDRRPLTDEDAEAFEKMLLKAPQ